MGELLDRVLLRGDEDVRTAGERMGGVGDRRGLCGRYDCGHDPPAAANQRAKRRTRNDDYYVSTLDYTYKYISHLDFPSPLLPSSPSCHLSTQIVTDRPLVHRPRYPSEPVGIGSMSSVSSTIASTCNHRSSSRTSPRPGAFERVSARILPESPTAFMITLAHYPTTIV